jgi:hypothetical protein
MADVSKFGMSGNAFAQTSRKRQIHFAGLSTWIANAAIHPILCARCSKKKPAAVFHMAIGKV